MFASLLLVNGVWCQHFEHGESHAFVLLRLTQIFINFDFIDVDMNDDDDRNMHPSFPPEPKVQRLMAARPEEFEISYWKENAQKYLKEILATDSYNTPKRAKNMILFMGDGMSLATVAATRVYMGGEEKSLSFERFPHFGLSKVHFERARKAQILIATN